MPITSIISQPSVNDLKAAYRPIVFVVRATRTDANARPPVVYCDIYVNGVYYKSQEKTQYKTLNLSNSDWQFDIQDACQEVLASYLAAPNGGSAIVSASPLMALVSCKFRSSGFDADGFITPEDTAPVQGTGSAIPVAGTGTSSNDFYVINATIQHDQNQIFTDHLNAYKTGTWGADTYPLTHRPAGYKLCENDSDYFPIVDLSGNPVSCVVINYTLKDGTTGSLNDCSVFPTCPIVSGISISPVDNGNGTQTFTFTWGTPDPLLTAIVIQYRDDGSSDPFTSVSGSTASGRTITLPLGLYEFKFQMNGACNTNTSSTFTGEGISAPACVPVSIVGTPVLPDGFSGVDYSYSFNVAGDAPYSVTDYVGPAWLTPSVAGNIISLTGTPEISDEGTGISVAFTIENACGSVPFSDTIDITSLARTLSFSAVMGVPSYSQIIGALNAPVDVDFDIVNMLADGYDAIDCSGSASASVQAHDLTIIAGGLSQSGSVFPTGNWALVNSFTITSVTLRIAGSLYSVFPGDVLTIGSYSVTIIWDGC